MRIGIYLDNEGHKNVNLNFISLGNPGIGGSEYWGYMLGYYLTEHYKDIEFIFFTTNKLNLVKQNISNVIVKNVLIGVQEAKDNRIDVFILNKHANVNTCDLSDLCNLIDEIKLPTITFGQNFYSQKECDLIEKCKFIKRNIFVSRQQYFTYSDLDINRKSSYIYNFINTTNSERRTFPSEMIVTYTGSLVSTKGFHILARNWKKILRECPDAKLKVIGSGKLYFRNTKLGKYNIADQDYEKRFMPYLLDENGNILDSVEFLGLLSGSEMNVVYKKTTVGIVNPSGLSETFCISAIELESMGVPVVSKKYGGLVDTISDKETGLLFNKEKDFISMVVKLLKDKKLNDEYSRNAFHFVQQTFSSEKIIPVWYSLFHDVVSNKALDAAEPKLLRKIKKIIYALQTGAPPLNKIESLQMSSNNYEKFNKPKMEYSLQEKIRNKIQLRTRIRKIYDIFPGSLYGYVNGVNASKAAFEEQLIFPEDKFVMPEMKDVFGQTHKNFHAYEATIPPFYVRSFKNAYCFSNREEIFSLERNVVLEYTSQKTNPLIGADRKIFHNKHVKKLDARVALIQLSGLENNYYHWLMECLGRYYLLERSTFKPDYYVLSNHKPFQQQFIDLLGIENERIIPSSENALIQARELIVPSLLNNWEYVDYRGYRFYQKQYLPAWIGNLYKEKVLPKIKETAPQKIFISRNLASYRKIENEDEIVAYLVKRGFKVYCLETMTVQEQAELFANASMVVGPHSAGFVNMIFSPRNTIIFELFSEFYHDAGLRILAKALGLNYFYMVGRTRNIENVHPQKENIYIDLNLFDEALNIIFLDKEAQ